MPELPEVETTRRDLEAHILSRTVAAVSFPDPERSPVRGGPPEAMAAALKGRQISGLTRRGKYLVMTFTDGAALILHRRMTGNLVLRRPDDPVESFTRAVIHLDDGAELRWTDQRRFGTWDLTDTPEALLPTLGPEPLADEWTAELLQAALAGRTAPIKATLLDQRRVAGLGNIYVDESLHRAGIHPQRPAGQITQEEAARLYTAVREVLARAIELQGSSSQHYLGGFGQRGSMQDEWRVYKQAGQPCTTCGTPISKIKVGGRGTHFCPSCQT